MALRYGSKSASALRYNSFVASALRYGSKIGWTSGGYDENATPAEYFTFTSVGIGYSIKAADLDNMPENVIIPRFYNGKPVTQIGEKAFWNGSLDNPKGTKCVSVVIPSSITTIMPYAFAANTSLKSVIFDGESKLTTIVDYAFTTCSALENIIIPKSVSYIGGNAFYNCSNLTIYFEAESKGETILIGGWNSSNRPVVWGYDDSYFTFTELADGTYSVKAADVTNLPSKVGIPYSYNGKAVTTIAEDAFRNCKTITTVVIPNSITSIGADAFNSCTNLTTINIPSTVTEIGSGAFFYCTALATIVIPSSVVTIGDDAFAECSALSINCEVTEANKPSGWSEYWNSSNRPVTWGYTG